MDNPAEEPVAVAIVWLLTLGLGLAVWASIVSRWSRGLPALSWRRRRRVPWGIEGLLLPAMLTGAAVLGAIAMAAEPMAVEPVEGGYVGGFSIGEAVHVTIVSALMAGFAALLVRRTSLATPADFGVNQRGTVAGDLWIGTAACLAAMPLVYAVQTLVVSGLDLPSSHPVLETLAAASPSEVFAAGWLAVVVAPLLEEFAFRALLQGWLQRYARREAFWPVVVSAATFALAHQGQGYAPVALFFFGLVIGYVYLRTHRLLACVVTHMMFNGLSLGLAVAMA